MLVSGFTPFTGSYISGGLISVNCLKWLLCIHLNSIETHLTVSLIASIVYLLICINDIHFSLGHLCTGLQQQGKLTVCRHF